MKKVRTHLEDRVLPSYTKGEEIFNMVSHIAGGALAIAALVLCVIFAVIHTDACCGSSYLWLHDGCALCDVKYLSWFETGNA